MLFYELCFTERDGMCVTERERKLDSRVMWIEILKEAAKRHFGSFFSKRRPLSLFTRKVNTLDLVFIPYLHIITVIAS